MGANSHTPRTTIAHAKSYLSVDCTRGSSERGGGGGDGWVHFFDSALPSHLILSVYTPFRSLCSGSGNKCFPAQDGCSNALVPGLLRSDLSLLKPSFSRPPLHVSLSWDGLQGSQFSHSSILHSCCSHARAHWCVFLSLIHI